MPAPQMPSQIRAQTPYIRKKLHPNWQRHHLINEAEQKALYQQYWLWFMIDMSLSDKDPVKEINMLWACQWILSAWKEVQPSTIDHLLAKIDPKLIRIITVLYKWLIQQRGLAGFYIEWSMEAAAGSYESAEKLLSFIWRPLYIYRSSP